MDTITSSASNRLPEKTRLKDDLFYVELNLTLYLISQQSVSQFGNRYLIVSMNAVSCE